MIDTGGVSGASNTVLSRQRDLSALRAENQTEKQTAPTDNQPVERETTRTATVSEPTTAPEAVAPPVNTPVDTSTQKIEEILIDAAEEGRETTRVRAEGESRNQPVAESEIGGTVNITT